MLDWFLHRYRIHKVPAIFKKRGEKLHNEAEREERKKLKINKAGVSKKKKKKTMMTEEVCVCVCVDKTEGKKSNKTTIGVEKNNNNKRATKGGGGGGREERPRTQHMYTRKKNIKKTSFVQRMESQNLIAHTHTHTHIHTQPPHTHTTKKQQQQQQQTTKNNNNNRQPHIQHWVILMVCRRCRRRLPEKKNSHKE